MKASFKSVLVLTAAAAIAITSLDLRPAFAAPQNGVVAKQAGPTDFSAARKRRRGRGINPAVPLAAFGAIVGTIGAVAAEQRRRDYYDHYYGGPAYSAPVYQPNPYQGYRHYGGGYGHPGYQRGGSVPPPGTPPGAGGGGGAGLGDRVAP